MGNKINNYIDMIFQDIPNTTKAKELREELLANLTERYEDYISQGHSENKAYGLVIGNIGDIDEILQDVMPINTTEINNTTPPPTTNNQNMRNRELKARNKAIAMTLYMAFPVILIGFSELFDAEIIGLLLGLSCVALATGLLVYTSTALPTNDNSNVYSSNSDNFIHINNEAKLKLKFKQIDNIITGTSICIYLTLGFLFGTWVDLIVLFIIASILCSIIKTSLQLKNLETSEYNNKENLKWKIY